MAGRLDEAKRSFEEALSVSNKLRKQRADVAEYRDSRGAILFNLAHLAWDHKDFAEVGRLGEMALAEKKAAVELSPQDEGLRHKTLDVVKLLTVAHLAQGDHVKAARTVSDTATVLPHDGKAYGDAAQLLTACVELAEKDERLTEPKRRELVQTYGDSAVQLLAGAVRSGFRDVSSMEKEPGFAPLRSREDFQQILAELKRKAQP
jgi:hypothetical protein